MLKMLEAITTINVTICGEYIQLAQKKEPLETLRTNVAKEIAQSR